MLIREGGIFFGYGVGTVGLDHCQNEGD